MQASERITSKSALLANLAADEGSQIVLLRALIQAASPNPPGDTRAAARVVTDYLDARGIRSKLVAAPGGDHCPNIVASFACATVGRGRNVVLNAHLDVFPVADEEEGRWEHGGPWSGWHDEAQGLIYGRGAVDMKAGTAALVVAFAALHGALSGGRGPSGDGGGGDGEQGSVTLTVVSDEETGGRLGSRFLLEQYAGRDGCRGDVMLNAEPGGLQSIRFAEKGTLRLTFAVRTAGAHGAYLHLSEGANRVAARLIAALLSVETLVPPALPAEIEDLVRSERVRQAMDAVMGSGASDLALTPTVNIGVLRGGVKVNTIPAGCEVQADIRLPIGMAKELVLRHIRDVVLAGFPQVEMQEQEAASNAASWCDPRHEIVRVLGGNAEALAVGAGARVTPIPSLGATDAKFWRYAGVPAFVYGVSPETMAAVDERVRVDEFLKVARVHAATVWEFMGGEE